MKVRKIHDLHILALGALAVLVAGSALLLTSKTSSASPDQVRSSHELTKAACDTTGPAYINVTQKIINDADSGEAGNYWAFDTINRHIQVWRQADGTYCAVVDYDGKFDSQAGKQSPGNTGVLTGNEDGTFKGGYRGIITAGNIGGGNTFGLTEKASKTGLPLKGNIGTTDYRCDLSGNCPGAFSWIDAYFGAGSSFTYSYWGWEYNYRGHTWVNAQTGNSGDIL